MTEEKFKTEFIIKNGEKETKYIYDFEILTPARIFQAIKFMQIHQELMKNPPQTELEISAAAIREAERHFYASILCKQIAEDQYEPYATIKVSSFDILDNLRGTDNYKKLMRCKSDFFYSTNILNFESLGQLNSIMSELKKLTNEDQELLSKLIDAALKSEPGESTKTSMNTGVISSQNDIG